MKLSSRQSEILDFIREFMAEEQMPPTMHEIAAHMGYRSDNAAYQHLKALEAKGALELYGHARGIRLLEPSGLPVVGRVAAGSPILAEENIEDHIEVRGTLFSPRADYLLRVHGMSMREASILDGDLLAVHKTPTAEQRQIVVARLDGEVTVKRFRRRGHSVTLESANPDFAPIKVDLRRQALSIEGLGVGVIRNRGLS